MFTIAQSPAVPALRPCPPSGITGTGDPREAYEIYAPVFEGIRNRADVICYPTVPMGPRPSAGPDQARIRYEVVERLAR